MIEPAYLFACAILSTIVEGPGSKAPAGMVVILKDRYGASKVVAALSLLVEHALIEDPTAGPEGMKWLVATAKGKNFDGNFKLLMGEKT